MPAGAQYLYPSPKFSAYRTGVNIDCEDKILNDL